MGEETSERQTDGKRQEGKTVKTDREKEKQEKRQKQRKRGRESKREREGGKEGVSV